MAQDIILAPALQWSGALRRALQGQPAMEARLMDDAARPITRQVIHQWFKNAPAIAPHDDPDATELRARLRHLRRRVFYALMVRDIGGAAPLHEVVAAMSTLADLTIAQSYAHAMHALTAIHGAPLRDQSESRQDMLILGMGKLGGKELNVSSDIDLIMLYGAEGETNGRKPISHGEFYGKVCRLMTRILSDADENGIVFRTDLRLRPDGNSGPLAWNLAALQQYLLKQGREWERYAWLKARIIPCAIFAETDFTHDSHRVEALRKPFVYRKYLDFDSLTALRTLRERIRQDWLRRARARHGVDTRNNIKLGEGGIREIEFVVQLNQLIRGGRQPSLQQRNLLAALHKQHRAGLLSDDQATGLQAAYLFLRQIEHRLQYREDEQTHLLPRSQDGIAKLAKTMGYDRAADFTGALEAHRGFVSRCFRDAFRIAGMRHASPTPQSDEKKPAIEKTAALNPSQADAMQQKVDALLASHRIGHLPELSHQRLLRLLPSLTQAAAGTADPLTTLQRLLDLIEQIAQRSAYLALLAEYPETMARVARIAGASPWASQYLTRFPLLLDSLIEWQSLLQPPDFPALAEQLRGDLDACVLPDGRPDIEQQMNLMRDLQHQVTFKLLALDLENAIRVESLADHLSALADLLLAEAIARAWPQVLSRKHAAQMPEAPHFAIIAYGKLGGKELGYASDLDLVFLYDDPGQDAGEQYARLGRRVASWLSTLTSSGRLYEIDLRLRPDGEAGLLAVPVDAFEHYQLTQAWPWEHQALTRARFVAGDANIGARFEAIRRRILLLPRNPQTLRDDVRAMRLRIAKGHPNRGPNFDIKHDRGGMVDVEFITQYLVLSQARAHRQLLDNLGNITLLKLAADAQLIPAALTLQVTDAYRKFRKRQHELRMQGAQRARVPQDEFASERQAVRELWRHVLGDE